MVNLDELVLKVVLIGDSGVGKSNLVMRYTKDDFEPHSAHTIGFEFATKTLEIESKIIKAQIWDTAGQERFQSLTAAYYRSAVGCLLVYDITRRETFQNIKSTWMKQIQENAHENLLLILVGNKSDLVVQVPAKRKVSRMEGIRFAEKYGMDFVETSAYNASNVIEAFTKIIVPIGRLLSPRNPMHAVRLPRGWKRVVSRTRPGEYSYENQYTKERVAFIPTEPAKSTQYHFQVGQGLSSVGVTVTREQLMQEQQLKSQTASLMEQECACSVCIIL